MSLSLTIKSDYNDEFIKYQSLLSNSVKTSKAETRYVRALQDF